MYIGSFDFGQMLNQPGLPQNQVFGQPVQGGDALGSFMGITPETNNNSLSPINFDALNSRLGQTGGNMMQSLGSQIGNQLTSEFLQNIFQPQAMPEVQPMSPMMASAAPQLSNPYTGLLTPQPINPMQSNGLLGAQPMQPMNPMLGGPYGV